MKYGVYHTSCGYSSIILFIVITAAVIAAVIAFIKYMDSKKNSTKELSEKQKENLNNFSSLVSAMLAQQGHGLRQIDICQNLALPCDIVAEKLSEMEKEELILRKWENDEYTFIIKKR